MSRLFLNELVAESGNTDPINIPAKPIIAGEKYVRTGRKNFLINGAMAISQETGFGSEGLPINAPKVYFVADEWFSQHRATTGQLNRSFGTLAGSKSIILTAINAITDLSGANYSYGISTKIESQNIYHLNSKKVTVSFMCKTNWSGKLSVCLMAYHTPKRSYIKNVDVVAGENQISFTVQLEADSILVNDNTTGLLLSIGFQNEGTFSTATSDSWINGEVYCTPESTQWTKTLGNSIEITQVQLEEGDSATGFEHKLINEYLIDCQRYYEKSFDIDYVPQNSTSATAFANDYAAERGISTNADPGHFVNFKVTKRAASTLTRYGNNSGFGLATTITGTDYWHTNAAAFGGVSDRGFYASQQVVGNTFMTIKFHWTADARL